MLHPTLHGHTPPYASIAKHTVAFTGESISITRIHKDGHARLHSRYRVILLDYFR